MDFNHEKVEKKRQQYWADHKTFKTGTYSNKEKVYALDMFPYPSGSGLHVGHPVGYTATDVYSRMMRMRGYEVLHPMGWDAFGLDRKSTRLNSSHVAISYAVFYLTQKIFSI